MAEARNRTLDIFRGIAVLLVIIQHAGFFTNHYYLNAEKSGIHLSFLGFLGVDIFFVLSGFFITRQLLDRREKIANSGEGFLSFFKGFTARRAKRILPLFLLFLLFSFLVGTQFGIVHEEEKKNFLIHLFFLSNIISIFEASSGPAFGILWSLATEEQFYLLWPFIVWFFPAQLGRISILAYSALLVTKTLSIGMDLEDPLALPWIRPDGILVGTFLAWLLKYGGTQNHVSKTGIKMGLFGALWGCFGFYQMSAFLPSVYDGKGLPYGALLSLPVSYVMAYIIYFSIHSNSWRVRPNIYKRVVPTRGSRNLFFKALTLVAFTFGKIISLSCRTSSPILKSLATVVSWTGERCYFMYLFHMFPMAVLASMIQKPLDNPWTYISLLALLSTIITAIGAKHSFPLERKILDGALFKRNSRGSL
jgi:peptidoglycan/LPS O-acetylase OafA/YrhL